jgi:hypothetical protein
MASLSDFQQKTLWEAWLSAEIRAGYFALLSVTFQARQRYLTIASAVLSSGATLSFLITVIPPNYTWVRPVLTVLAAVVSAVSVAMRYERAAIDSQDLHSRWNSLAMEYEDLWSNIYAEDASDTLKALRKKEAEVSKSGVAMPTVDTLLIKAQDNVLMHHQSQVAA